MRVQRVTVAAVALTAALVLLGAPASAKGGEAGGRGAQYLLTNGWSGSTDVSFRYGRAGDRVLVGDWDGDGTDTPAVRRGATYYLSNSLSGGHADRVVTYGRSGDTVLMGDWDGDGTDTPMVRRGATYHLRNDLSGGRAERVLSYGRARDVVIVGDWDGDGRDTLGVRRGNTYYLTNSLRGGRADAVVSYGRSGDDVVVGDWDGRGGDTLGVRRGNVLHVKNSIAGGPADRAMAYGSARDTVLVGDWDGDGTDTIGLRRARPAPAPAPSPETGGLTAFDDRMVELVNGERRAAGVAPVTAWPPLRAGALSHSRWMIRTGTFEHAPSDTIWQDGYTAGCEATSENIFWGAHWYADEPDMAMAAYMDSPGHRANILDPDNRFVAVGSDRAPDGSVYNTQRFARSCF